MAIENGIKGTLRTLAIPAAVSAVGGAVGLFLSRKPKQLRDALPQLPEVDVGGLKGDLRGRLDSALGKDESESEAQTPDSNEQTLDRDELEERRGERQKRREQRKQRLGAS
jgi:hypothetical protein